MFEAPATDPVIVDLQKSIVDLQTRARKHVDGLDERLRALVIKQGALKIPKAAFVAKVLEDIRKAASAGAVLAESRAKSAQSLKAHFPIRHIHSVNFNGEPDFVTSEPGTLNVLDYKSTALDLVGMLPNLFEPALEAWAGKLADELGLPATGNIADVRKEFNSIQAKIEMLSAERMKAQEQLSELVSVTSSPFIDQEAFMRLRGELPPLGEAYPEDKNARPVGVYDEHGKPKSAIGSDGWNEFWAKRRAEDAAEKALEAEEALVRNGRL